MDGWLTNQPPDGREISVAFLTPDQAELYGGYVEATKLLKVNIIRSPTFIEDHWSDIAQWSWREVGHA